MRRLILFLIILLIVGGGWFILRGADALARHDITALLHSAGFTDARIGEISAGPRNTAASDIKLDRSGLDTLKSISVSRGWANSWSDAGDMDITIDSPDIYREITHINALLPAVMGINRDTLATLPKGKFIIRDGRVSLTSPLGDFQLLFDIVIDPAGEDGRRLVSASIKSYQDTLDFVSEWRGWIESDGTLLIDTLIPEMKAAIGPVRITRGNGWLSLSNAGPYPALSGQIESGAARLRALPLQNFNLTLDLTRASAIMMMRAGATGAPGTLLSADMAIEGAERHISLTLSSNDPERFATYLEESLGRPAEKLKAAFKENKNLFLAVIYQPAKRFAGGPYPFDLRGAVDEKEFVSGTFLIYPGTFDMRGSAKVAESFLPGIREYFKIPDDVVSGDYIRLDASLAPFFSGVGAGVVNDAGKGP